MKIKTPLTTSLYGGSSHYVAYIVNFEQIQYISLNKCVLKLNSSN